MEKNVLKIYFGDNDFGNSLYKLGEFLLENPDININVLKKMRERKELSEILSNMFRGFMLLNQHRFDMYERWHENGEILKSMESYKKDKYFDFKPKYISFINESEIEGDNGEVLFVDFENDKVLVS